MRIFMKFLSKFLRKKEFFDRIFLINFHRDFSNDNSHAISIEINLKRISVKNCAKTRKFLWKSELEILY